MTASDLHRGTRQPLAWRCLALLASLALAGGAARAQLSADFSADVTVGANPLTVQFSDATTGGDVFLWLWDLGDGTTTSGPNPVHTYTAPGVYDVSLEVFAAGFQVDSLTQPGFITVQPAPIVVDFTQSAASGSGSLDVQFTDTSTGAAVTSWLWDFGDGSSSTEQHPSHTYLGGGPVAHDVSLTVTVEQQVETLVRPGAVQIGPSRFAEPYAVLPYTGVDTLLGIDADGDGDQDLVVSGSLGTRWLPNDGQGQFASPRVLTEVAAKRMFAADFTADGADDLLALGYDELFWMEQQDGSPAFAAPVGIERVPWLFPGDAGVGDVDGDGHPDPVYSPADRGAFWYPNRGGDGSFDAPVLMTTDEDSVEDLELADVDLDGDLDMVWASNPDDWVAWTENVAGDGSRWELHAIAHGFYPQDLAVGDFDRDGDPDAVWDWVFGSSTSVWAANPTPATGEWPQSEFGSGMIRPAVADLDADGQDDLVYHDGDIVWRPGQIGPGPRTVLHDGLPDTLALVDVDGDGDRDLVGLVGFFEFAVMVFENRTDGADWPLVGAGLAGSQGVPTLHGSGALAAGEGVSLALESAAPGAPATLVLGLSALEQPFRGGVLVPLPEVLVALTTDGLGRAMLQSSWPAGVPAGIDVYAQLWIVDPAAVAGFSATNGSVGTTLR